MDGNRVGLTARAASRRRGKVKIRTLRTEGCGTRPMAAMKLTLNPHPLKNQTQKDAAPKFVLTLRVAYLCGFGFAKVGHSSPCLLSRPAPLNPAPLPSTPQFSPFPA